MRTPRAPGACAARRRRQRGRQALRRGLDQRRRGRQVRHRHRQHVRVLGLGRRSLFDGFGDRPVDDARDRRRRISARCSPGFHAMDEHFRSAPFERNLPVLHRAAGDLEQQLPRRARPSRCCRTTQYLKRFPAYLQQLTMESNGKHVTLDGARVDYADRPDLLGRARHQRPAFVLPADPPGHAARSRATSSASARRSIRSATSTTC